MYILFCDAPTANGYPSGEFFYVAKEATDENGRPYPTITKNRARAKVFATAHDADEFNKRMMTEGTSLAKPFDKQRI